MRGRALVGRTLLAATLMALDACHDSLGRGADAGRSDSGIANTKRDAATSDAASHAMDAAHSDAGSQPSRTLLASSGAQLLVQGSRLGLQLTAANLSDDADVCAIHQEFYGIPWAAFEADTAPPREWAELMAELAAGAKQAARPVFLSVNVLNGTRERLAATTRIEDGQVKTSDETSPACYDFAAAADSSKKRDAYLRYLDFMLETFEPKYLNIAIEVNLFFEKCPAARAGLIQVINDAYAHAKRGRPGLIVFPSFQIDHLYGYSKDSCPDQNARDSCFDAHYAQLAGISRDRFAMSSYPFLNTIGNPSAVPKDYFERAAARGNEHPLIAETGWPSTPLIARMSNGSCNMVFDFNENDSAAYLERVLGDAKRIDMELVTWWSDRDLVTTQLMTDCPCTFDSTWCTVLDIFRGPAMPAMPEAQFYGEVLLKAFGSMGLRDYSGKVRTGHMRAWNAARGL